MESLDTEDCIGYGFRKFEQIWTQKLEDKIAFENLSEEELTARIEKVKRNCFILGLQSEVIEKYLHRHDPSAIRELNAFMKTEENRNSSEIDLDKICGKKNNLSSTYDELTAMKEKLVIGKLIEIVNQEITDLCMNSKTRKKKYDKEVLYLNCNLEAYKSQAVYLNGVLKTMNDQIPSQPKGRTDMSSKVQGTWSFMEDLTKKVTIDLRKISLEVHSNKKKYLQTLQDLRNDDTPVIPADLKLIQIEIKKLNSDILAKRSSYMKLTRAVDRAYSNMILEMNKQNSLKQRVNSLNILLKKLSGRLSSIQRYRESLEKMYNDLKFKEEEFKDLSSGAKLVVSPKEYILLKENYADTLRKIRSMQRKVIYSHLCSDFETFLKIKQDS